MRISISNLAWDVALDREVAGILNEFGLDAIDIAPGKYFPDPCRASAEEVEAVRRWWSGQGIAIVGMQALLFGTRGLNLFGDARSQHDMLEHLKGVCGIGARLGARRLVFGSPKNRDRSGLPEAEAQRVAEAFLRKLGEIAEEAGVVICLEPTPTCYGANFMTNARETAEVVRRVGLPSIRMQLDLGAMATNGEDPREVVRGHLDLLGHIHLSEPRLAVLGTAGTEHGAASAALREHCPDWLATIEMLTTNPDEAPREIRSAIEFALKHFGCPKT